MNGKIKFHPGSSPAFNQGEVWHSASGGEYKVWILCTRRFSEGKFDVDVTYEDDRKFPMTKDVWNFQVRYVHQADKDL